MEHNENGNGTRSPNKPRKRYASDERHNERRRRPSFFKAHTSILGHRKMSAIVASDATLAAWLRFGLLSVLRGAAQTDNVMTLTRADLRWICGGAPDWRTVISRWDFIGKQLGWNTKTRREKTGIVYEVEFRNFAKKQGFTPRNSGGIAAELRLSPLPSLKEVISKHTSRMQADRSDDEKARIENLQNDIDEATNHNGAGHLANALPEPVIRRLVGLTKEAHPKNPAAYLTTLVSNELAKAKGVR